MVLVTHDQTEAMSFADEVVVMNHGRVVQAAAPQVLFDHPLTEHVGRFIGSPAMNFLPAVVSGGRAVVPDTGIAMPLPPNLSTDGLTIGFRPETARFTHRSGQFEGRVSRIWFEGMDEVVALSLPSLDIRIRIPAGGAPPIDTVAAVEVEPAALRLYRDGCLVGSGTEWA
ncbi:ABC transporter ATP-binding protein [Haematobacter missouriensis]|uniref:MalK-like OB fold domain-containing protein n=1 Tax=Haematobacter missouriensis TaxID=366616 RepID=A0A212AI30_9RHOB|nr:ABC transporter ATP-binding protein [Haematobacter missouriensis]OWJ81109.1 hypothetical protein CDV52_19425 [Haematobacter missouriensis]